MAARPSSRGEGKGMRRGVIGLAVAGMVTAMLAGVAGTAGAAAPCSASTHPAGVKLAGVVNVASLPKATGHVAGTGAMRQIPLRTAPAGRGGTSGPLSRTVPGGARAPLFSFSAGASRTPALKDSDNTSGLTPPDMGVGADATHVVQMVNVVGKIWTSGVAGSAFQLDAFFLSTGQFVSDPWVMYDQESGRWFAGIFNVTIGGEAIAISTTGSPTGTWFVYKVTYPGQPGGGCPDQGKGGVDTNVLGLGFNEFSGVGCTGGFLGAGIEVFNKAEAIAGATLHFCYTTPLPAYFSLVPAQALTTAMSTLYFASN